MRPMGCQGLQERGLSSASVDINTSGVTSVCNLEESEREMVPTTISLSHPTSPTLLSTPPYSARYKYHTSRPVAAKARSGHR